VSQFLSSGALANLQKLLGLAGGDATQNTTLEDAAVQLVLDVGNLSVSSRPGLLDNSTFYVQLQVVASNGTNAETLDLYNPPILINQVTQSDLDVNDIWVIGVSAKSVGSLASSIDNAAFGIDFSSVTAGIGNAISTQSMVLAYWEKFVDGNVVAPPTDRPSYRPLNMRWPRNIDGAFGQVTNGIGSGTVEFTMWCELVPPGGRPSAF